MRVSIVRLAANEYHKGNYAAALRLYRDAADLLGEAYFALNITLCEKKLQHSYRTCEDSSSSQGKLKVACVMDTFTYHCYQPECDLFPLTPDNAVDELESFRPDLLFIESAWRGKDDLWEKKIASLSAELKEVLAWCKQWHVPTVFWNKEDPVHFESFLTTARHFDHVFTTDIDCIARYKAALGHNRVYLLPFACQPKLHNPIELYARKDAFCFAGAYYVRYPERTRDLENYISELPKFRPLEIYDRNFGKGDANYQFPAKYQPYIVGTLPFDQIAKAYKGYRYSINLNSVKQSQTMFARRVYELLASNTITVSNFSRGVRQMFGDLVITSDNGKEIVDRLRRLDDTSRRKLQLAGLRKVMLEHSYERRLAYVAEKALCRKPDNRLPNLVVIALIRSANECQRILGSYQRQKHERKRLVIVLSFGSSEAHLDLSQEASVEIVSHDVAGKISLGKYLRENEWLAPMVADDYYGPNYLTDLAIATKFSDAQAVGKSSYFQWTDDGIKHSEPDHAYRTQCRLPTRASATHAKLLDLEKPILPWLAQHLAEQQALLGLAIDPFNYCRNGYLAGDLAPVRKLVDDLELSPGIAIAELIGAAEKIPPAKYNSSNVKSWTPSKLRKIFGGVIPGTVVLDQSQAGLTIVSKLPEGAHQYIYAEGETPIGSLSHQKALKTHLELTPGAAVSYVFIFLDDQKRKITHAIHSPNRNNKSTAPDAAAYLRVGLRILGPGSATIKSLLWGHRDLEPPALPGRSSALLLTNHYPSYDDLYRNGFVHSRVKAYLHSGVPVDVFRLRENQFVSYHEFQEVDVTTGSSAALHRSLANGGYHTVLVHFLSAGMWETLKPHLDRLRIIVWVHGAEIQPWHRRDFNYESEAQRELAKQQSEERMSFWRGLLREMPAQLKLVFVSKYFAEEVMEDLGFRLPDDKYEIIHNPIDTDLFVYQPKPVEQRKRILSIRPYASRKYANDLSVQAILRLSQEPWFNELEFRLIGDGAMFDEVLAPLRGFDNVVIERRFLTQPEIASLHQEYGLFLCPTRMDAQGVSRDEAMASGLVPVTNAVTAIPEFVDDSCGILAPGDDSAAMAEGIARLYLEPERFAAMSAAAAARVRRQTSAAGIINAEVQLITATAPE